MQAKIKTVDVNCREWFDRVNGNSYFSGVVTINYGTKSAVVINLPFQYGYGSHYQDMAFKAIIDNINKKSLKNIYSMSYWRYYNDNNIIYRHSMQTGCKKREL